MFQKTTHLYATLHDFNPNVEMMKKYTELNVNIVKFNSFLTKLSENFYYEHNFMHVYNALVSAFLLYCP